MSLSRQQRRSQDRERARLHPQLYRTGLHGWGDAPATALLTHHLIGILKPKGDQGRASKAAAAVHKVFEATLAHHEALPALDCKKGCAHCCSLFVSAAVPEILLLAKSVLGSGPETAVLAGQITQSRQAAPELKLSDPVHKPVPCGLLVENLCARYAERPLGCRGHVSQSLDACLANIDDPLVAIPGSRPHGAAARDCKLALFAALKAVGLPHRSYELNAALERAIEIEDAERRWLAGEDPFEGVALDPSRTPETEALLDKLIAEATV